MKIEHTVVKCAAYLSRYIGKAMYRGKSSEFTATISKDGLLNISCDRSVYSTAVALEALTDMEDMDWCRLPKRIDSIPAMDKVCSVNFYTEDIGEFFIVTLVKYDSAANIGTAVIHKETGIIVGRDTAGFGSKVINILVKCLA